MESPAPAPIVSQPAATVVDPDQLVHDHLPLVHHVVADVLARVPRHVPRDELVSAALLGLVQAAKSFDPDRGVTFDRYARRRMRGALLDDLRSRDWASRGVRAQARKHRQATDELTTSLGRAPTNVEAAAALGVSRTEVDRLTDDVHRATVLNYDAVFREAEDTLVAAEADPGSVILERERRAYLMDAVNALPERLRLVVVGCFFEERPMLELAQELGVTESRVSQMKAEALALIREGMDATLEPREEEAAGGEAATAPAFGRVARRKAAYFAAVAASSSYRDRLAAEPVKRLTRQVATTA